MEKQFRIINKGKGNLQISKDNLQEIVQPATITEEVIEQLATLQSNVDTLEDSLNYLIFQDRVLQTGEITTNGLVINTNDNDFSWILNGFVNLRASAYTTTLNPTTNNYIRYDILIGKPNTIVDIKEGVESDLIPTIPAPDDNTILLAVLTIKNNEITSIDYASVEDLVSLENRVEVLENVKPAIINGILGTAKVFWTGVGYIYDIVYDSYILQNVTYPAGVTTVTLDAAHPSLNRLDVFALNASGGIVLTGVPDNNPQAESTEEGVQLYITLQLIEANTTAPDNINTGEIYRNNEEWLTVTASPSSVNFDNTTNEFEGTKCIEVIGRDFLYNYNFVSLNDHNVINYTDLTFRIKPTTNGWNINDYIAFEFYKGTAKINEKVKYTVNPPVRGSTSVANTYMYVTISFSSFKFTSAIFDRLIIENKVRTTYYIDALILHTAIGSISIDQNSINTIITDNGVLAASSRDYALQLLGQRGIKTKKQINSVVIYAERASATEFIFVQKGFGNTNKEIDEIGDIFTGFSNDGLTRFLQARWNGGVLTNSDNFTPYLTAGVD